MKHTQSQPSTRPCRHGVAHGVARYAARAGLALAAALLLMAVPATVEAQRGGGHGDGPGFGPGVAEAGFEIHDGMRAIHHLKRLARALDLTEAQQEEVKDVFSAAYEAVQPIRDEQRQHHEELKALLDSGSAEATAVGELVLAIHANRGEVRALHESALDNFKDLLTSEQLATLEEIQENRQERRGRRGRHHRGGGDS